MTDLPFTLPGDDPTRPAREPRKCQHDWRPQHAGLEGFRQVIGSERIDGHRCARCGRIKDLATAKRGRNNRKRGVSDELAVARLLGGRKVGQLGEPYDVIVDAYMRAQCKRLDRWPSLAKVVEWLDAIPAGPELRAVTLADTPGPGGRTRRLIVMDLEEFARWHGRRDDP